MIEKLDPVYVSFQKKIVPYLDGSMEPEEEAEFEAFVATHPEFEKQIQNKQLEIQRLKNLIPVVNPTKESLESIESEIKLSIDNLFLGAPESHFEKIKSKL